MTDIFDQASEIEEMQRKHALTYRKPILSPIGKCYYCLELVEENRIFCNSDCRDGYSLEQAAKERNGR